MRKDYLVMNTGEWKTTQTGKRLLYTGFQEYKHKNTYPEVLGLIHIEYPDVAYYVHQDGRVGTIIIKESTHKLKDRLNPISNLEILNKNLGSVINQFAFSFNDNEGTGWMVLFETGIKCALEEGFILPYISIIDRLESINPNELIGLDLDRAKKLDRIYKIGKRA